MKFEKLPNGALLICSEPEDRESLTDMLETCGGDDTRFLSELLEYTGWEGNGRLYFVEPGDVGALTEAPMLTDDSVLDDDGSVEVFGPVWWFPNYMVENFAETLVKTGRVVFPLGAPAMTPA